MATVAADAASFVLSALGLRAIGERERPPGPAGAARPRRRELLEGWRFILGDPALRPLFFNTILVNGLILATAPLLAVLMLGELGFAPLAVRARVRGAVRRRPPRRAARPRLVARFGATRSLRTAGALRACWSAPARARRPGHRPASRS